LRKFKASSAGSLARVKPSLHRRRGHRDAAACSAGQPPQTEIVEFHSSPRLQGKWLAPRRYCRFNVFGIRDGPHSPPPRSAYSNRKSLTGGRVDCWRPVLPKRVREKGAPGQNYWFLCTSKLRDTYWPSCWRLPDAEFRTFCRSVGRARPR